MISPELLRRYPFFGVLDDTPLKAVAMVADEFFFEKGDTLYEIDRPAEYLYVLIEGSVEHYFIVLDSIDARVRKEFYLSDINPGEVFALSAMVEPYRHTTTARCTSEGRVIRINTTSLRTLAKLDPKFGASLMTQVARSLYEKLESARVQLAAARA
jgi:CRP-like cAMP-binding protein